MTNRILDFSERAVRLRVKDGCLCVESLESTRLASIAIADIESVILSHPQVSITQSVLGRLAAANVAIICCDERQRPVGMLLPLEGHNGQGSRFRGQIELSPPRKKRLWQSIVKAKIQAQALVLEEFQGADFGLRAMAKRVGSGDAANLEAQAARRYWPLLFPETTYRRRDEDDARNHILDYGYAVLRAAVTRRLCGVGLHPSIELHHRSTYNTFRLADDVMEPYRPAIDRVVRLEYSRRIESRIEFSLDAEAKRGVIGGLTQRYRVEGETRTLLDVITRNCQLLASAIMDRGMEYSVPEWKPDLRKDVSRAVQDHVDICDVRSTG